MAMSAASMALKVKAQIEAITNFPETGINPVVVDIRVITAICTGIIQELTTNMVVLSQGSNGAGPVISTSTEVE